MQRWLELSQKAAGDAVQSQQLYKVFCRVLHRLLVGLQFVLHRLTSSRMREHPCDARALHRSRSATAWNLITLFHPRASMQSCTAQHPTQPRTSFPPSLSRCFRYDERLRRWGGDKQSHAYELAANSFEFFVVPLAAIVHQPHNRVKSWAHDSGIACVAGACLQRNSCVDAACVQVPVYC